MQISYIPTFHTAVQKILDGRENQLNALETNVMVPFKKPAGNNKQAAVNEADPVKVILMKRKNNEVSKSSYYSLEFIPPTSCDVERLFSISRHILTYDRSAITPKQFEELIFLRINSHLWDVGLVSRLASRQESIVVDPAHPEADQDVDDDRGAMHLASDQN
jgi:hypothetical protein